MWKCIFDSATNRGTGCFREPQDGEFAKDIHPAQCGWFSSHPARYMWDGSGLAEWPGWAEEADEADTARQKEAIAEQRYALEIANMSHDGHEWYMDREARTTLYLTIAEVLSGDLPQEYFKTSSGWYLITPENAAAIKAAGREHVKAAFAWEKAEVDKLV